MQAGPGAVVHWMSEYLHPLTTAALHRRPPAPLQARASAKMLEPAATSGGLARQLAFSNPAFQPVLADDDAASVSSRGALM